MSVTFNISAIVINNKVLISEINDIGFIDIRLSRSRLIVIDAAAPDASAIQSVIDTHDPSTQSASDIAIQSLLDLDLSENLTTPEVQSTVKDIVRALRHSGALS